MIKETDISLNDYYYYPSFRSICKECCLGFVKGGVLYNAVPCSKCKDVTGFTMEDKNKILSESMTFDDFYAKVKYYSHGIDTKTKILVDMDQVTHEHYLQLEKANKGKSVDYSTVVFHPMKAKPEKGSNAAKATAAKAALAAMSKSEPKPEPKPKEKPKPKPKEKIDFREIALGALFNSSQDKGEEK